MKINTLFIIIPLVIFISCASEQTKIEHVFEEYQHAQREWNGKELFKLLDKNSKTYLKNLHNQIKTADSFQIARIRAIDAYNIISARSLISNDSLLTLDTPDVFEALFSNQNFEYTYYSITNPDILKISVQGKNSIIKLQNGFKIKLTKEDDIWRINLKSIYDNKNNTLKDVKRLVESNHWQVPGSGPFSTIVLKEIANSTTKPFDLLFWPPTMNIDDIYVNEHFSKNLDCDKNQTWALVQRPKILFFLTEEEISKDFYSKFRKSPKFRMFCKNKYSVIALTADCFAGRRFFQKFNIKSSPRILVLDSDNTIIQESWGYFITPEMFIENSHKTGLIKYDLKDVLKTAHFN